MVKQSCAAPGTGTTITLAAAQPGYSSFDVFGNAQPAYFMLTDGSQSELQAGTVTVGSPSSLSRGTPLWNSAGTFSRLNFTGTCTVYSVTPAERALFFDANNALNLASRRVYGLPATHTSNDEPARVDDVAWRWLSTQNLSVSTGAVVFALPSGYPRFRIEYQEIVPAAAAAMYCRWSHDGGITYVQGATEYIYSFQAMGLSAVASGGANTTFAGLSDTGNSASAAFGALEFQPTGGKFTIFEAAQFHSVRGWQRVAGMAVCSVSGTATHIQIGAASTTMAAGGRFRLSGGL